MAVVQLEVLFTSHVTPCLELESSMRGLAMSLTMREQRALFCKIKLFFSPASILNFEE